MKRTSLVCLMNSQDARSKIFLLSIPELKSQLNWSRGLSFWKDADLTLLLSSLSFLMLSSSWRTSSRKSA